MKKLLVIFATLLVWGQIGTNPAYAYEPDRDEDILVTGIHFPDPSLTRPRSLESHDPNIKACLHYGTEQLEVTFEYYSGDAIIEVLDWTGTPVIAYPCNTMSEWNVYLPMPADDGAYTLRIYIANAEYVGRFMLVR